MEPSQVAATLRRIAAKIEASKNPDRSLVARDLKRVVAEVVAAPAAPQWITMSYDYPATIEAFEGNKNSENKAWQDLQDVLMEQGIQVNFETEQGELLVTGDPNVLIQMAQDSVGRSADDELDLLLQGLAGSLKVG